MGTIHSRHCSSRCSIVEEENNDCRLVPTNYAFFSLSYDNIHSLRAAALELCSREPFLANERILSMRVGETILKNVKDIFLLYFEKIFSKALCVSSNSVNKGGER